MVGGPPLQQAVVYGTLHVKRDAAAVRRKSRRREVDVLFSS